MALITPKRYAALVGIGMMYLWGATLLAWVDWWRSEIIVVKTVGIVGMALASLSGIAAFFYVNDLESQVKMLKEKKEFLEDQAKEWMNQAQLAISLLEKERNKNGHS